MPAEKVSYAALARRYCDRQASTPAELLAVLKAKKAEYAPEGFVLLECQDLSSSYMGSLVILPYGPKNTLKEVPAGVVSPRGLASDMSTAVAYLPAGDLPDELPDELKDWAPPPAPEKPKRRRR